MRTIKCKGETVEPTDIEVIWTDYSYCGAIEKKGDFDDYAKSRYSDGYDDGLTGRIAKSGGW